MYLFMLMYSIYEQEHKSYKIELKKVLLVDLRKPEFTHGFWSLPLQFTRFAA